MAGEGAKNEEDWMPWEQAETNKDATQGIVASSYSPTSRPLAASLIASVHATTSHFRTLELGRPRLAMDRQRHLARAPRPTSSPGWKTFDTYEKPPQAGRGASWLASLTPGSARAFFPYNSGAKHPWESPDDLHANASIRLRNIKRTLLRRFSPWTHNGSSRAGTLHAMSSAPGLSPTLVPSVSTVQFVLLCALWYATSALSSNTGKVIMLEFRYPITLTFVQFAFVAAYCLLFMSPLVGFSSLRSPTKAIFHSTVPMGHLPGRGTYIFEYGHL